MRLSRGGTARQLCPQSFNAGGSNRLLDGHRCHSTANRFHQRLFDQDLVDIVAVNLRLSLRGTDHEKPMTKIRFERRRVVCTHEREYLLVALPLCCLERCGEQTTGDTLTPQSKVDICTERAYVIERSRVRGERLHDLKTDEPLVRSSNGHLPDSSARQVEDVIPLGVDTNSPRCKSRLQTS